jgi:hypothetical protein
VIVLVQNKTIIHLKNQNQDIIIIKNQHNLLNKIKIMLNKKIRESLVIHVENRTIIHNNIKDLQKTKY